MGARDENKTVFSRIGLAWLKSVLVPLGPNPVPIPPMPLLVGVVLYGIVVVGVLVDGGVLVVGVVVVPAPLKTRRLIKY